jgi:hypothetical protein
MKNLFLVLALALVIGCGVKEKPSQPSPVSPAPEAQPTESPGPRPESPGALPTDVYWTKDKKFLVYLSKTAFKVGNETVTVRLLSPLLVSLPSSQMVRFSYRMPEMAHGVTPVVVEKKTAEETLVTYHISMRGLWEFTFEIIKDGKVEDTLVHTYTVR